jgi:hypothetical protein
MEQILLKMGPAAFASYKRLAYEWWYAFAEFVDNSTQAYLDNQDTLDKVYKATGQRLTVKIIAQDDQEIRIIDNSLGMSLADLKRAMSVAVPPPISTGRCRYGMGMKTAASWMGNKWNVTTKRLGETTKYTVNVDVDRVANGDLNLPFTSEPAPTDDHYTIVRITHLHRPLRGRTVGKVKDFLSSIYRVDIASNRLHLEYNDVPLSWALFDNTKFLKRADGSIYRKNFDFEIISDEPGARPKRITGWVGILQRGARADAGFSILHRERVIRGWPTSWRPYKLFGEGRNDLINQRLVGEVHLEDFEVSHTKDSINWYGDEEDRVEIGLQQQCQDYARKAREPTRNQTNSAGPNQFQVDSAVKQFHEELTSPEFLESLAISDVLPTATAIKHDNHQIVTGVANDQPTLTVQLGQLVAKVFLSRKGSVNDPYLITDSENPDCVQIVINVLHPHWSFLTGDGSLENYLRHCVYDGIAEHRARHVSQLDPDTVKRIKDAYLRVAFSMLQNAPADEPEAAPTS